MFCFAIFTERTEIQIRGCTENKSKIFFLFPNENICCDPSLEPSQRDGSNEGNNICFCGEIGIIILKLPLLIWSTERNNFCDAVFAFLGLEAFSKWDLLLRKRIYS